VVASSRCKGDGRNEGSAGAALGKAACRRLYPKPRGQQQALGPWPKMARSFACRRFGVINSCRALDSGPDFRGNRVSSEIVAYEDTRRPAGTATRVGSGQPECHSGLGQRGQ
jgi:hypothetical protein